MDIIVNVRGFLENPCMDMLGFSDQGLLKVTLATPCALPFIA